MRHVASTLLHSQHFPSKFQVIIFAGGMTAAGDQLLDAVKVAFKDLGWTILEHKVRRFEVK